MRNVVITVREVSVVFFKGDCYYPCVQEDPSLRIYLLRKNWMKTQRCFCSISCNENCLLCSVLLKFDSCIESVGMQRYRYSLLCMYIPNGRWGAACVIEVNRGFKISPR